jgi:hypothetical protein
MNWHSWLVTLYVTPLAPILFSLWDLVVVVVYTCSPRLPYTLFLIAYPFIITLPLTPLPLLTNSVAYYKTPLS